MLNFFKKEVLLEQVTSFIQEISDQKYPGYNYSDFTNNGIDVKYLEDMDKYFHALEKYPCPDITQMKRHAVYLIYYFSKNFKYNTIITPKNTYDSLICANVFEDIAFVSACNYNLDFEVDIKIYPKSLDIFVIDNTFNKDYHPTKDEMCSELRRLVDKIYPDIPVGYFSIHLTKSLDKN